MRLFVGTARAAGLGLDPQKADDEPRVRSDGAELLRRADEEVQLLLRELVEALLPDLGERLGFVAVGRPKVVPVEGAGLPVENL